MFCGFSFFCISLRCKFGAGFRLDLGRDIGQYIVQGR